jgi:hypothetical protein
MEVICECGFICKNTSMYKHKGRELCTFLKTKKYNKVRGKDKVKCSKCKSEIMVCGLHIHDKYCNK